MTKKDEATIKRLERVMRNRDKSREDAQKRWLNAAKKALNGKSDDLRRLVDLYEGVGEFLAAEAQADNERTLN